MAIAIIPARGGSKRIPRKNLKQFCGKPMISYAIEAAKQSQCFEHIVVSTDDPEIAEVARQYGASVPFLRDASLSDDYVGTTPVMLDTIQRLEKECQISDKVYCCIYATSPLLDSDALSRALALLKQSGAAYVFSAAEYPYPIQRALKRDQQGFITPFHLEHIGKRSQDLESAYQDAGQFYWGIREAWLSGESVFEGRGQALILPRYKVVDIDTPEDWKMAELLFRALHFEK
ncbi:pseudaminic acid cytidylyltransferase [Celerinatantimonas diazotrophica]|uniref:N-acylneuraminate cytidylyltransferase n=1 Tax=Celerinatantimonas diazotrophica TaxID=412034 RepID=A0A4R1K9R1_9GAMM|nr:pseudaminic acid cytidylyltransferase [Celerinatantimonas diazotrophica]TCK61094.1 N-acylneuraminate cytidylyltransferase [Celerinatantimonas diazotrophica]CAG9295143.1 CMP-N,N'-diacetyllegionaminic acid synthase [Celerinatantimonas diazotrophica]